MQWSEPADKLVVFESLHGPGPAADRHSVMPRVAILLRRGGNPAVYSAQEYHHAFNDP